MTHKPLPSYEKALNEQFVNIYKHLSDLKSNRSRYIDSKHIYQIYDQFLNLLHELKLTRKDEELKGMTLSVPNHNDLLIDDIWELISLCFVTCGLIKFAPATYSSLSTVGKLLDHLKECQVYTLEDLEPIRSRLEEIGRIIDSSSHSNDHESDEIENMHQNEESLLLRNKLKRCRRLYSELEANFRNIPQDLEPVYKEALSIRKNLLNMSTNTEEHLPQDGVVSKIKELKERLKAIEGLRDEEGRFKSSSATADELHSTQIVLNGLMDDCFNLINDISIYKDTNNFVTLFESLSIGDEATTASIKSLNGLYKKLIDLKLTLENLVITRRWTMRETDLYGYQKLLKEIDDERMKINSSIEISDQNVKRLQLLVLYLLRRCYSLIYKLLESSEPVSESLQPIHNQLTTVRRCLLELKRVDGLNNLRELYPFQFKLASLDNLRDDGKFIINNQIPEGQGTLNALLAECFDIIHELKIELEEKEDERAKSDSLSDANADNLTDIEDIKSDDEVELKRNRYMGFNEADYDQDSESEYDLPDGSDSEFKSNDYY